MAEQTNELGSKIDALAVEVGELTNGINVLGGEIKKLATAISQQTSNIAEQKSSIDHLVEESRQHNETAKIQAENIARLIDVVNTLVVRN